MPVPLTDLLDQVALSVLKYINSKRAEHRLGKPISQEVYLVKRDLEDIKNFFNEHIQSICADPGKPEEDRTGRRPHLEYMISAVLYFKNQLALSNTLEADAHQTEKFKILLTYFISTLYQLVDKDPVEAFEICDETARLLLQEREEMNEDDSEADFFIPDAATEPKKYSLISFYYQTVAAHVTASAGLNRITKWAGDINSDMGTLGKNIKKEVFSCFEDLAEKELRIQVSEIITGLKISNKAVVIEDKATLDMAMADVKATVKQCQEAVIENKIKSANFQQSVDKQLDDSRSEQKELEIRLRAEFAKKEVEMKHEFKRQLAEVTEQFRQELFEIREAFEQQFKLIKQTATPSYRLPFSLGMFPMTNANNAGFEIKTEQSIPENSILEFD